MIRPRKSVRGLPTISTASLPDIVFILLFFFMTVTVMKDTNILVENSLPNASEAEKLQLKDGIITLYVGQPIRAYELVAGVQPQIQLGNKYGRLDEVKSYALQALATMPEHIRSRAVVTLKVDQSVGMGIISDIKTALRGQPFKNKLCYGKRYRGMSPVQKGDPFTFPCQPILLWFTL